MESNCSTIILSINGLRASALGAYGQTSYETPGFDRLATEAITYDWCFADTDQASSNLSKVIQKISSTEFNSTSGYFATDDTEFLDSANLNQFLESKALNRNAIESIADSIGQTHFAATFTRFGEQLAEWFEHALENESTCNAWLHLKGLEAPWDAPQELSDYLLDEEDSPITPSIEPAHLSSKEVNESTWCEARFQASCRYAAQVMVLDACLEGLLDFLEDLFEGQNYQFILLGTSGYSLGEHGEIRSNDGRLYSEQQHVPILWKTLDPKDRFSRRDELTLLSNFRASTPLPESDLSEKSLLLCSQRGNQAVRTNSWYLIKSKPEDPQANDLELYLKPDDRWEQNDIHKLEIATTEELLALTSEQSEKQESN